MTINLRNVVYFVFVAIVTLFSVFGIVEVFEWEIFYDMVDTSWVFIVWTLFMVGILKGKKWSENKVKTND